MKHPTPNKEVMFKSQEMYLNNLFDQLRDKKIELHVWNGIMGVNEDLGLMYCGHYEEEEKKVKAFEYFVWNEYSRVLAERIQMLKENSNETV